MPGYYDLNSVLNERIENLKRYLENRPLILGSVATSGGGSVGRPTSFIGNLPQTRVSYDLSELALSGTDSGSPSLLDNLNHIRYRLGTLEAASGTGPGTITIKEGNTLVASGITVIDFLSGFSVDESPTGEVNVTVTASGGHSPVTVQDTGTIDFTLNGQEISAVVKPSGILLDGLGDVEVGTATSGHVLKFIGAKWIPATVSGGAGHDPVTVSDTGTIDLTLNGQLISAIVKASGVDHNALLNTHNLTTDIDHTQIQNIGTNTHAQIDTHLANTVIHFDELGELVDVDVATVVSGEYLKYIGAKWINVSGVSPTNHTHTSSDITDLADITTSGTDTLDLINDGVNLYGNVKTSGILLDDLGNTILTTPASGEVLTFMGTNWRNATVSGGAGHDPVTILDTGTVDLTLNGQQISAVVKASGIDHDALLNTHNLTTDIDHTAIQNIGTNTHAQIDTHISDTSIHFDQLGELSDVDTVPAVSGYILKFLGTNWVAASGQIGAHTHTSSDITDLADITTSGTATLDLINDGVNLYGNVLHSGVDHSKLLNLGIDSHTQYALVNGGRHFTGTQHFEQNITTSGQIIAKKGASPYSALAGADNIIINASGVAGIAILGGTNSTATMQFNDSGKLTYDESLNKFLFSTTQDLASFSASLIHLNVAGFDTNFRVDSQNVTNILSVGGEDNLVGVGGQYLYPYRVYVVGDSAFAQGTIINLGNNDSDTRIAGTAEDYLFYVDAGNDRIGIGTNTPGSNLELFSTTAFEPKMWMRNRVADTSPAIISFIKERAADTNPNSGDQLGLLWFGGWDTGGSNLRPAAQILASVNSAPGATYVPGKLEFKVTDDGGTLNIVTTMISGVQLGSPTGGDKGLGTLNAAGDIYKNDSAYTNPDYVLEQWATGKIVKFKDNPGAEDFKPMSIKEIESHIKETHRLPGIDDEPMGMFERGDRLLELVERLYVITIEQQKEIDKLRETINDNNL